MRALVDHRASGDAVPAVDSPDTVGAEVPADELADVGGGTGRTGAVQDRPEPSPAQLRVDFGAHLEANYQRLVAQLYAITLDPGEAHDVVQDAYSRAWRDWAVIGRSADPGAWVRRVAVRSTIRSWRRLLARLGVGRPNPVGDGADPRTGALLSALGRLPAGERRAVVLFHMAGVPLAEIAAVEQVPTEVVEARLARAQHVVTEGLADVLPEVLGLAPDRGDEVDGRSPEGYDPEGYDPEGYDAGAYDNEGYAADGYAADRYAADRYDDDREYR